MRSEWSKPRCKVNMLRGLRQLYLHRRVFRIVSRAIPQLSRRVICDRLS